MSVVFNADNDRLSSTANLPSSSQSFTMMGWFLISSFNNFRSVFGLGDSTTGWFHLYFDTTPNDTLHLYEVNGTDLSAIKTSFPSNTWHFGYLKGDGSTAYGGCATLTQTGFDSTSRAHVNFTPSICDIGDNNWGSESIYGRVGPIYLYDTALTNAEIEAQKFQYLPVRTANLNRWSAFLDTGTNDFYDYSGNGRNWTETNSVDTNGQGPPIPWKVENFRRKRAINARNYAIDMHTNATAHSLTIPTTDIRGTARPYNTNYDCGAWEYEAFAPPHFRRRTRFANLLNL